MVAKPQYVWSCVDEIDFETANMNPWRLPSADGMLPGVETVVLCGVEWEGGGCRLSDGISNCHGQSP